MEGFFGQVGDDIRLDWGLVGARAMRGDVSVVVDVLSFSTAVTIAVSRGMRVFPYPGKEARAEEFARSNTAVLAVGRREAAVSDIAVPSLSPAGLLTCAPTPRLVLPSPNGSSVAVGCLRNAKAIARWFGATLECWVAQLIGAANIRTVTLFPRDLHRVTP